MSGHSSTQAVLVFMKRILSQSWFYLIHSIMISDKTRNRQACRDDYVHNVHTAGLHTAGLHTSDRLLLEAVREVNLFDHAGIRTGDPRSDRRQVQDFTTELRVLE